MGSGVNRALAEYGACKINEVLGAKADAEYPEQVGHAKLFSIDWENDTIISVASGTTDKVREVARVLSRSGYHVNIIEAESGDVVTRSLEASLHLQRMALDLARRRGLTECAFLTEKGVLRVSNKLIY